MRKKNINVFIAMSGGVDSSVAALILKNKGYSATGVFMKNWTDSPECAWKQDIRDARRTAALIDIPFRVYDFRKQYKKEVVDYMVNEYKKGRTPNPDVMCNKKIKFDLFLRRALKEGADFIATGHYVKISSFKSQISNPYRLCEARDKNKDQSYFLWALTQKQLKYCLFPIGNLLKKEVRSIARRNKLPSAHKKDSQGICFIGEIDLKKFLKKFIKSRKGDIIDINGGFLGYHDGAEFFTIGQRRGIGIGGGIPYYIISKKIKENKVIVAPGNFNDKLYGKELKVGNINWISGRCPNLPMNVSAKIRYRQPKQRAKISRVKKTVQVEFKSLQRAITPGQSIVFYSGSEMIGGGIIK